MQILWTHCQIRVILTYIKKILLLLSGIFFVYEFHDISGEDFHGIMILYVLREYFTIIIVTNTK